jgi:hypothetical protein
MGLPFLGVAFGPLLIFFSFIFWKLDQRNHDLIEGAEATLKFFESKAALEDEPGEPHIAKRFTREEFDTNGKMGRRSWAFWHNHYSYSQCFRFMFVVFSCVGLVGFGLSVAEIVRK